MKPTKSAQEIVTAIWSENDPEAIHGIQEAARLKMKALSFNKKSLVTLEEVMHMLSIDDGSDILRMVRSSRFPRPFLGKNKWVRSEIYAWLDALRLGILIDGRGRRRRADRKNFEKKVTNLQKWVGWTPPELEPVKDQLCAECTVSGVYFLLKGESVVYVGSSVEPTKRVKQHTVGCKNTKRKDFDSVIYLPVILDELLNREKTFVVLLNPPDNSVWKKHCQRMCEVIPD